MLDEWERGFGGEGRVRAFPCLSFSHGLRVVAFALAVSIIPGIGGGAGCCECCSWTLLDAGQPRSSEAKQRHSKKQKRKKQSSKQTVRSNKHVKETASYK